MLPKWSWEKATINQLISGQSVYMPMKCLTIVLLLLQQISKISSRSRESSKMPKLEETGKTRISAKNSKTSSTLFLSSTLKKDLASMDLTRWKSISFSLALILIGKNSKPWRWSHLWSRSLMQRRPRYVLMFQTRKIVEWFTTKEKVKNLNVGHMLVIKNEWWLWLVIKLLNT